MSKYKLTQGDCLDDEIARLYVEDKLSLRAISRIIDKDHHYIKRRLDKLGIPITNKDRKREPFTEEHKRKISEATKGRANPLKGKKTSLEARYKNMINHIQWTIDLDFVSQFPDIEKLKFLNKLLSRDRVSIHFDTEKYKQFIYKFYFDEKFNQQFEIYSQTKNKYDMPSLDHIVPLSKGGNWELNNLQILSWFENRAKCDMMEDEFNNMIKRYFMKEGD